MRRSPRESALYPVASPAINYMWEEVTPDTQHIVLDSTSKTGRRGKVPMVRFAALTGTLPIGGRCRVC